MKTYYTKDIYEGCRDELYLVCSAVSKEDAFLKFQQYQKDIEEDQGWTSQPDIKMSDIRILSSHRVKKFECIE